MSHFNKELPGELIDIEEREDSLEEFYKEDSEGRWLDLMKIDQWISSQEGFDHNHADLPCYSPKLKKAIKAFNDENHRRFVKMTEEDHKADAYGSGFCDRSWD